MSKTKKETIEFDSLTSSENEELKKELLVELNHLMAYDNEIRKESIRALSKIAESIESIARNSVGADMIIQGISLAEQLLVAMNKKGNNEE